MKSYVDYLCLITLATNVRCGKVQLFHSTWLYTLRSVLNSDTVNVPDGQGANCTSQPFEIYWLCLKHTTHTLGTEFRLSSQLKFLLSYNSFVEMSDAYI
jgi:hypothetical protein